MKKTIHMQPYRRAVDDLRNARLLLNISQLEAGRRLGVTRHWVAKAESCEVRLDIIQFIRVCRVYRVDAGRLLGRLEEELSDEDGPSFTYQRPQVGVNSQFIVVVTIAVTRDPLLLRNRPLLNRGLVATWWPLFCLKPDLLTSLAFFEYLRNPLSSCYLHHNKQLTENRWPCLGCKRSGVQLSSPRPFLMGKRPRFP